MAVLDVASGTGNAALPAAAAGAKVTACDLTPELLDEGRSRAEAAGLTLEWTTADAEQLPFDDASFDVVMSSIGAMFAPQHQAVADELVRVCRPGGTIALLSWTPEGMIGALFRTMGPFAPPPPPGAQPPPLWGSEAHLGELFGERVELRDAGARRARHHRVRPPARLRRACSRRSTARRSPPAPTPRKDGREAELDAGAGRVLRRAEPRQRRRRAVRVGVLAGCRHAGVTAVRRATREDAPAVGQLLHDFNHEFDEPAPAPAEMAERIAELMDGSDETIVLLTDGSEGPDGLAVLRLRPSLWSRALECYLAELYVIPEYRRQGRGLALMDAAMATARAAGADYMDLGTGEHDTGARALYERLGFVSRDGDGLCLYYEREL